MKAFRLPTSSLASSLVRGPKAASWKNAAPPSTEAGRAIAEHMFGLRFVGTPEQLADRLADLQATQSCDGFNIIPAALPDDLGSFIDRTVPLLRRKNLVPARPTGRTLRERLGLPHPRSRYEAARATA